MAPSYLGVTGCESFTEEMERSEKTLLPDLGADCVGYKSLPHSTEPDRRVSGADDTNHVMAAVALCFLI